LDIHKKYKVIDTAKISCLFVEYSLIAAM